MQQQGLWEYVSDVYSGSMERTYAPGQGNVVFCASWFLTISMFCAPGLRSDQLQITITGSNNSKVCSNKAFGNMFLKYILGVWSGHMLQDKETLRLAQITPDHHFLDEFFCCCWFCASWFLTISLFCAPGLRPSGRLDGHTNFFVAVGSVLLGF